MSNSLYKAVLEGDLVNSKVILGHNPEAIYERNEVGHTPLMASATTERPDLATLLLQAGAPVDEVTPDNGYTALHWALLHRPGDQQKILQVVDALIEHGVDVNVSSITGVTPLMLAAWSGIEAVVKLLLLNGADKSMKDDKGRTARDIARERKHVLIEKLLF